MHEPQHHPRRNDYCVFQRNNVYPSVTWTVLDINEEGDIVIQSSSRKDPTTVTLEFWSSSSGQPCRWVRPPIYSVLDEDTLVQRLDSIEIDPEDMPGIYVYHPYSQIEDDPIWVWSDYQEYEVGNRDDFGEYHVAEMQWIPPRDEGVITKTFYHQDGMGSVRAQFKDPDQEVHGLHYEITTLWVKVS